MSLINRRGRWSKHGTPTLRTAYLFSIAIAPLYFGGERLFAWGISGVLQSIIMILGAFLIAPLQFDDPVEKKLLNTADGLITITLIWATIQIIPFQDNFLAHPVWTMANDIIGSGNRYPISLAPDEGALTLVKILIVCATFINGQRIYSNHLRTSEILIAVAVIGTGYAIIGLIWSRYFPGHHIWLDQQPYGASVVSTYVNRNTFAQYLGIACICAIAIVNREWQQIARSSQLRRTIQILLTTTFQKLLIYLSLFLTLLVTLLLTASRAGIIAAIAGIIFVTLLQFFIGRRKKMIPLIIIFFIMGFVVIIYSLYSGLVDQRSSSFRTDLVSRTELYSEVSSAISDRPILGYGLGSFENVFRFHKSINFDGYGTWHRAHNVYLDLALALGIPFAVITVAALFIVLTILARRIVARDVSTSCMAMFAIFIMVALHSLADFSIQSGGNAITFSALLGGSLATAPRRITRQV